MKLYEENDFIIIKENHNMSYDDIIVKINKLQPKYYCMSFSKDSCSIYLMGSNKTIFDLCISIFKRWHVSKIYKHTNPKQCKRYIQEQNLDYFFENDNIDKFLE